MKKTVKLALGAAVALAGLAAAVWALNVRDEVDVKAPVAAAAPSDSLVARGAYLARAGNCMACHTARGGQSYAGGLGIATPFGTVFTSNLTPDDNTGIGSWSPAHFWRAMHNGRSKNGRLLYPAFPYPNYTQVTREDSDALFAYLSSLPPVVQPNRPTNYAFPISRKPRWRCGVRCISAPACTSPMPTATPNGTAAPTWSRAWATAAPATPHATPWAPAAPIWTWPVA